MNQDAYTELYQILDLNDKFKSKHGFNPFDNYFWREMILADKFTSLYNHNCVIYPGRTGPDAHIPSLNKSKTETKSCSGKLLKSGFLSKSQKVGEWDKQNDEIRRERTLKSDSFLFGIFDSECQGRLLFFASVTDDSSVERITKLLGNKQQAFIIKENECRINNKRISRDSIDLNLTELLHCIDNNDVYFNGMNYKANDLLYKIEG